MQLPFCVMCGINYRKSGSIYCVQCEIYKPFEKTEWYKEILAMQQKQRRIDQREGFPLLIEHEASFDGSPKQEESYYMRAVGRPKTFTEDDKNKVIDVYREYKGKISVRQLARVMNAMGMTISRETIRSYIKTAKEYL